MKVLLIKTSSMGDVIHTLPALTDARVHFPDIRFDWVVEEGFREIPAWHPAVEAVVPVAIRRWRKQLFRFARSAEWHQLRTRLKAPSYDLCIDAQGLLKTAWLNWMNPAPSHGLDRHSAREPLSSRWYQTAHAVPRTLHAITRNRQLFSQALGYPLPSGPPRYGLDVPATPFLDRPYVFLLHGTTWDSKHYPLTHWCKLVKALAAAGFEALVTWGNREEQRRAAVLESAGCRVMPRTDLQSLARALKGASAAISVDTGLGHLASALEIPVIGLYGPTNPDLSGISGARQESLKAQYHCAPCMRRRCRYAITEAPPHHPDAPEEPYPAPCWNTLPPAEIVARLVANLESVTA